MKFLLSIGSRYLALIIQFCLVLLITSTLPQSEAGLYFAIFGVVTTLFALPGFGLPDGLVKTLGNEIALSRTAGVRATVARAICLSAFTAAALAAAGASAMMAMGLSWTFAVLGALWYFFVSMGFVVSQAFVTVRAEVAGSFFFYSSINIFLLVTSVPYLLLSATPSLIGLLVLTTVAASLSFVTAIFVLLWRLRAFPGTAPSVPLRPAIWIGWVIALSRILQQMIYWIPVWVTTIWLTVADAAIIGAAGRLLIAVSGVIAALRFSVRPSIVAAAAKGDRRAIEDLGRRISLLTFLFTICAMLGCWAVGRPILGLLFTPDYAPVWSLLLVFIVGALGEAFGGPVDEVLRMTGKGHVALIGLIATILLEATLAMIFVPGGIAAVAWAQAIAFWVMYAGQVLYVAKRYGILIMPLPRRQPIKAQRT